MSDQECAAILHNLLDYWHDMPRTRFAIERAIQVLSPCEHCGGVMAVHLCHTGHEVSA